MSNKIQYRRVGDYYIPNIILPPEESKITLGKWGMIYKDYLLKNKKGVFSSLLAEGKLFQHCAEVERQSIDMFDMLVEQMKEIECVNEHLKEENQLEWIYRVRNIEARASEIVIAEIICI